MRSARLTREGARTAIIERKLFGGTCVGVGCVPAKTLVVSARAAHVARRGEDFSMVIDAPVKVDMKRVKVPRGGRATGSDAEPVEKVARMVIDFQSIM